ncbi:peptidylprolyl isomerase [Paraburkholderia kururiensis]|uniref:peptidylprolyl isomerase n=1 Tax=Paraburkholderia kururiensis TaxID=984307 RepID=UPI0012E07AC7|nr:peptidylprolyl isomerase [Paraburkholderia kururiensis]
MPLPRRSLLSLVLVAVASAAAAAPPPGASPAAPVALRVGDRTLSPDQYRELAAALAESTGSKSFASDENLLRQYAETALLADSARRQGVDEDGVVAAKIRVAVDTVLAEAERDRLYRTATVTDDDVRKRFEAQPGAYDEYALSHIFIACSQSSTTAANAAPQAPQRSAQAALARARQIKARLAAGADFDALARAYSDDRSSAQEGGHLPGSLGMFLAPEFGPAIRSLRVGEVSEPVRGAQGYHLIRVDAHVVATFENRHKMIEAVLRDEAAASAVAATTRNAPVAFDPRVVQ